MSRVNGDRCPCHNLEWVVTGAARRCRVKHDDQERKKVVRQRAVRAAQRAALPSLPPTPKGWRWGRPCLRGHGVEEGRVLRRESTGNCRSCEAERPSRGRKPRAPRERAPAEVSSVEDEPKPQRPKPKGGGFRVKLTDEQIAEREAQVVTIACARCGWSEAGGLKATRARFAAHDCVVEGSPVAP